MKNFIKIFIILYLTSLNLIKNQGIEDISYTISFDLINRNQKDSGNLTFDSDSTYIYPYNISILSNLVINASKYQALISTNLSNTVFISPLEDNCEEKEEEEDREIQIVNSQFIFSCCGPY